MSIRYPTLFYLIGILGCVVEFPFPKELSILFEAAERTAKNYIDQRRYSDAQRIYEGQLKLLSYFQTIKRKRFHKGASLHNLGLTLLLQRDKIGIYYIVQAFTEDALTYTPELGNPFQGLAARLLRYLNYQEVVLRAIMERTSSVRAEGKLPYDPTEIIADIVEFPSETRIDLAHDPEFEESIRTFFPRITSKIGKLVFIGGSFKTIAILRYLEEHVATISGYSPVLLDKEIPQYLKILTYHLCTGAMDDCDLSIFEVTIPEGQMAEIAHHYERRLYQIGFPDPPDIILLTQETFKGRAHIPAMIPPEYQSDLHSYRDLVKVKKIVSDFLM